jgi:PPM family protein phosphatase
MECRASAFSHAGGRARNEDAFEYVERNSLACYVLADGAGGHEGGAQASRACVRSVVDEFIAYPAVSTAALCSMLHNANLALLQQQDEEPSLADMRSTLIVLLIDSAAGRAVWGHIGDSRLYLFRRGALHLRTRDHSLVQSMVDSGMLPQESAAGHSCANVLFSSMGLREAFEPTIVQAPVALLPGDALLLCSDGVWGVVDDVMLERCLAGCIDIEEWLLNIEREVGARISEGADNYTALGIWCGDADDFMRTMPMRPAHARAT